MCKSAWALAPVMLVAWIGTATAGPVVYEGWGPGIDNYTVAVTAAPADRMGGNPPPNAPRVHSFSMSDSGNALGLGTNFLAWCLDIVNPMVVGSTYDRWTGPGNPFGAPNTLSNTQVARVQAVFDRNFASVMESGITANQQNDRHVAFQLALWEAAYEDDANALDLGNGALQIAPHAYTPGAGARVIGLANSYLSFTLGEVDRLYNLTFLKADYEGHQDLITASPIPLPAAAWLLIGGIGTLVVARRRRTDAASA